jgi:transcription elongation factor GreA
MSKIPITTHGAEMLRAELQKLKSVERPTVITAIAEARAQGDITENAEYEAARERQGFIEGRIIELEAKLANAQIIDPKLLDDDGRVVFGSTVELMTDKETVTYQIVGEDEADLKANKISYSSPIAKGIIGKYSGGRRRDPDSGRVEGVRDRGREVRVSSAASRRFFSASLRLRGSSVPLRFFFESSSSGCAASRGLSKFWR